MPTERLINPNSVETAEYERSDGDLVVAAEIAADAMGLDTSLLADVVEEIAQNPEQRAVLACLARIHVDATKSIANSTFIPRRALAALEQGAETIQLVYKDAKFWDSLDGVEQDHLGRWHPFQPEMRRDEAKFCFAAAPLYSNQWGDVLVGHGENLLEMTYNSLPEGHKTKPLIGIELQLSKSGRGVPFDREKLVDDFLKLDQADRATNPHRVATVASWLAVCGDEFIERIGISTLSKIAEDHDGWIFMLHDQQVKKRVARIRKIVYRYLTPITTGTDRREKLYAKLI